MADYCWLPSAIMQTTAALIGIFAVIYVLSVERLGDAGRYWTILKIRIRIIDLSFLVLFGFGIFSIYLNYMWLEEIISSNSQILDSAAALSFKVTLSVLVLYTLVLIWEFRGAK